MNSFGGNWTENKIDILVEYAQAYLTIMNTYAKRFNWKLMYFDGFAGSGLIIKELKDEDGKPAIIESKKEVEKVIVGAARRILELDDPIGFNSYYFVEKDKKNFQLLEENTKNIYPDKKIFTQQGDCNEKMHAMSNFLKGHGKDHKVLAYIDPCGMQLNWDSIVALADASVDMWILIPTGMGVNRLLTGNGKISEAWLERLESFLGMTRDELKAFFYQETVKYTLFGEEETVLSKRDNAIYRSGELYRERLSGIFNYVSLPYILKTKSNTLMYHFLMVSNNKTGVKIADEIITKYSLKK